MDSGCFYFISDKYFEDYPDPLLSRNKAKMADGKHNRPCFFAFKDEQTGLFWMIPISAQSEKYRALYQKKLQKYKRCDTIAFGEVLGYDSIFLIQNMCPVTSDYILEEYYHTGTNTPVRIDERIERVIVEKAKRVLALQHNGVNLILPDVLAIEKKLLECQN